MADVQWLFMHIPKTAGTSFRQIVQREYRNRGGLESVYDPDEVKEGPRNQMARAYIGHFRFGFHQHLNGIGRYVGFMREPIGHAWSHYHFLIEMDKLPRAVSSFSDFLRNKYGYNLQLRFISGVEDIEGQEGMVLEQAKNNVRDHFALLAPMERFDEALLMMKKRLDWQRTPVYHRANERPYKPMISEADIDLARPILKWEIELYEDVCQRFDRDFRDANIGAIALKEFKAFNQAYRRFDPYYVSLKRFFRFDSKNS